MWCLLEPIRLNWLHWLLITMRMLLLNDELCKNLELLQVHGSKWRVRLGLLDAWVVDLNTI